MLAQSFKFIVKLCSQRRELCVLSRLGIQDSFGRGNKSFSNNKSRSFEEYAKLCF